MVIMVLLQRVQGDVNCTLQLIGYTSFTSLTTWPVEFEHPDIGKQGIIRDACMSFKGSALYYYSHHVLKKNGGFLKTNHVIMCVGGTQPLTLITEGQAPDWFPVYYIRNDHICPIKVEVEGKFIRALDPIIIDFGDKWQIYPNWAAVAIPIIQLFNTGTVIGLSYIKYEVTPQEWRAGGGVLDCLDHNWETDIIGRGKTHHEAYTSSPFHDNGKYKYGNTTVDLSDGSSCLIQRDMTHCVTNYQSHVMTGCIVPAIKPHKYEYNFYIRFVLKIASGLFEMLLQAGSAVTIWTLDMAQKYDPSFIFQAFAAIVIHRKIGNMLITILFILLVRKLWILVTT